MVASMSPYDSDSKHVVHVTWKEGKVMVNGSGDGCRTCLNKERSLPLHKDEYGTSVWLTSHQSVVFFLGKN
jgi:hypothetical protein